MGGDVVEGNWKYNKLNGEVRIVHRNGDMFIGEWQEEKMLESGKIIEAATGESFEGIFQYGEDEEDGKGFVNFIYKSGPKTGEKYKFDGLTKADFQGSSNIKNELTIDGMKFNVNKLAK